MAAKAKSPPASSLLNRSWRSTFAVIALLAFYFYSAVSAVADKSMTFDEMLHLMGGYSAWKIGDFRLLPPSGILPQRWAALPLVFRNTHFPNRDQDAWHRAAPSIGEQFFYGVGNDERAMLSRGRAMIALLGVALGALVFFWARSLLGVAPAFVSLGLFAFCPTMLANGALVTSDMAVALFFSASMLCIWRVLHRVTWQNLIVGSLVMGCLFVSKFSGVLILPMGMLLVAIQLISRQPTVVAFRGKTWTVERRATRLLVHVSTIAVHAIVAWGVIWAFFDFRYDMSPTKTLEPNTAGETVVADRPYMTWDVLLKDSPSMESIIGRVREAHLLPETYVYGFVHTWRFSRERTSFLNGEFGISGWPEFFPYCLLFKTPLTFFALMMLGMAWTIRGWYLAGDGQARVSAMLASCYRTAPLWVLFVVYWAFAIPSHLNIGHRHLLPTYPPMFILAGASAFWLASPAAERKRGASRQASWLATRRWPALACTVLACIGLFAAESLWRWPNYLAYFNQIAGGPSQGYRHLVDSSLDWGQELPALQRWLAKEKTNSLSTGKTYFSYFGVSHPSYYGIQATLLPCYPGRPVGIPEPLQPGTYCLSATMLQNLYLQQFRGPWTSHFEAGYQELVSKVREFDKANPDERRQLIGGNGEEFWNQTFYLYQQARLARLTSFLRQREPDAEINYSILIYRLGAEDLNRALEGPPVELKETEPAVKE
jgi:hypothetical protein